MEIKKVIVVYKKTLYQLYGKEQKDARFLKLIGENNRTVRRLKRVHEKHTQSLEKLKSILKKHRIEAQFVYRADHFNEKNADLIISLGGDGTFLEAARSTHCKPILGIKSSPIGSVGMFCGVEMGQFEKVLEKIKLDQAPFVQLHRLKLTIDGKSISLPVLNDILITHANPAAMSRFLVVYNHKTEDICSSGLWVSPPAGSTGGIRSGGGKILPLEKKCFQFLIREPYEGPGRVVKVKKGLVHPGEPFKVISKMRKGGIYLDGSHRRIPFVIGETLNVGLHEHPLKVFAYNTSKRKKLQNK